VFIRLFQSSSRALKAVVVHFRVPAIIKWIHWILLMNLIQDFQCWVTYWASVEMLLFILGMPTTLSFYPTHKGLHLWSGGHVNWTMSSIIGGHVTILWVTYSAHQNLSNNTKSTFQFLQNFQLQFNLIFSEEIIQYSRTFALQVQTSWNQSHAPLLVKSFPKTPRTWSEASRFGGSHNYKTNYLPS
jgi:hypothetical protein